MHKLNKIATEFLSKNCACIPGYRWAVKNCSTLREIYETARPDWGLWLLARDGVLTDRELWLFACWCAEQALCNWYAAYPDDHRPKVAIETRRKWLDGLATEEELSAVAVAAARSAARSAVAVAAARSAARSAVAVAVARSAASAAWSAAAVGAAWSAASDSAQLNWLRENTNPKFVDEV